MDSLLICCNNAPRNKSVQGYRVVHEGVRGGWVWEPCIDSTEDKLAAEFDQVKNKLVKAQEKVEALTIEWEAAPEESKKEIAERLKNAQKILKSLTSARFSARVELNQSLQKPKGDAKTGFAKDFLIIQEKVSHRLSYNVLTKEICYDDATTYFNSSCLWLTETTGHINWNKSDNTLSLLILDMAKKNKFCPVKRYLESIEGEVSHAFLDQCVPYLFGLNSQLAIATFKAQLIGSIRRIYEPGCHHRLMPILYGQQKKGKSTFLRHLYGEFGSAGELPMSDKDGSLIIQRSWSHEIDECDKLFRTREASSLKSFVSLTSDCFRAPYERSVQVHPRRSVLWGTTNVKALFTDPTGNTRYPVIALPDNWEIPTEWVLKNRDQLWAAAINGYQSGLSNEIPFDLADEMAEDAENYADRDALYEPIERYLSAKVGVEGGLTLMQVAEELKFNTACFSKADQNRIAAILRSLGWESTQIPQMNGSRPRRWAKRNP